MLCDYHVNKRGGLGICFKEGMITKDRKKIDRFQAMNTNDESVDILESARGLSLLILSLFMCVC